MTARDFDPVFAAALRNELEARADRAPAQEARRFARLRRPQVWITAATALALLLATVGVLRLVAPPVQPAAPGVDLVDPLTSVTQPSHASYVARAVDVLVHARGVGTGSHDFDVPAGTGSMTLYVACTGSGRWSTDVDGEARLASDCSRETGSSGAAAISTGRHTLTVHVRPGTAYAVLGIRTPAPTIAPGAVIDPLAAVRDRHTPDALVGDARPVLQASGAGAVTGTGTSTTAVPDGVRRLRVFLVCQPSAATTQVRIDGHRVLGCMNSVAHWFDFTPSGRTLSAQVVPAAPGDWRLLVVRAPEGATDSPANALLPYPQDRGGAVLSRGRGVGAPASGTYLRSRGGIRLAMTCSGTGWLEVATADGGTSTRGNPCSTTDPLTVGLGGGDGDSPGKRLTWTAIPHGDVSWTLTILDGD
jgi:hypothetical protein